MTINSAQPSSLQFGKLSISSTHPAFITVSSADITSHNNYNHKILINVKEVLTQTRKRDLKIQTGITKFSTAKQAEIRKSQYEQIISQINTQSKKCTQNKQQKRRLHKSILHGARRSLRSWRLRHREAAEAPEALADPQPPRRVESTSSAQAFAETNAERPAQISKQKIELESQQRKNWSNRNQRWRKRKNYTETAERGGVLERIGKWEKMERPISAAAAAFRSFGFELRKN